MSERRKIKEQPLNVIRNNNYSDSLIIEEDHEVEHSAGGSGSDVVSIIFLLIENNLPLYFPR